MFRTYSHAPSWKQGFARCQSRSAHPNLWVGLEGAWLPALGPSGLVLRDISGYGRDGALVNMNPATSWIVGRDGQGLDSGSVGNETLEFATPIAFDATDPYSVSWRMIYTGGTGYNPGIYRSGSDSGSVSGWWVGKADSRLWGRHRGANVISSGDGPALNDGLWHSFTASWDGAIARMHVDSELVGSLNYSQNNSWDIHRFCRQGSDYIDAVFSFFLAHRRALIDDEIRVLHENPLALVEQRRRSFPAASSSNGGTASPLLVELSVTSPASQASASATARIAPQSLGMVTPKPGLGFGSYYPYPQTAPSGARSVEMPVKECPGLSCDTGLTRGLVLYWPFWESSGTRLGDLAGHKPGSVMGATWAHDGLAFDEVDDHATVAGLGPLPDDEWSWAGWIKLDNNTGTFAQSFLSWGGEGASPGINWHFLEASEGQSPNRLRLVVRDADGRGFGSGGTGITSNGTHGTRTDWIHLVAVRSGNVLTQYVDGVADGSWLAPGVGDTPVSDDLYLGARSDLAADCFLGGRMRDWACWDRSLSMCEIGYLFRNPFALIVRSRGVELPISVAAGSDPYRTVAGQLWHAGAACGGTFVSGQQAGRTHG